MKKFSHGLSKTLFFIVLIAALQVGVFAAHCVGHQHPANHTQKSDHHHDDDDDASPMGCCHQVLTSSHCQIQPVPPGTTHTVTPEFDLALFQPLQLHPIRGVLFFVDVPTSLSSLKNPNIPDIPPEHFQYLK